MRPLSPSAALLAVLRNRWDEARTPWPGVHIEREAFVAHCQSLLPDEPAAAVEAVAGLHVVDLYLAYACAVPVDSLAVRLFEDRCLAEGAEALKSIDADPSFADEVRQIVRQRLLVGTEDGGPRLLEYAGRGPLAAWVRITLVRAGLTLRRQRGREQRRLGDLQDAAPASTGDPELDYLRVRYRVEFEQAFRDACGRLPERERAVLRLAVIDGLSVDRIGLVYGVHKATAARWLTRARGLLFEETRRLLTAALGLSPSEFGSLARLVHSQLDVQLSLLLRDPQA
ncbi:sigma factor-like helix-turn-helix DNA-binding protein [Nannocystis pusilla]|uniref:sigma factor-like helix-turn-helix DNA-binding protein n=1 Tax=Nannocystis pusilla TaxID=889268 RepID=UPI003BEFAED3